VHDVIKVVGLEFISFRSRNELKKEAEELAKLERRDKSDEYREIFATGIAERRKQVALQAYSKGEVSMGKAAEIAGISIWDFLDLMKERGVYLNLTAQDILDQAGAI